MTRGIRTFIVQFLVDILLTCVIRLFDQVNAHPDLHFIVIVNPRNEAEIASALPQSYRTALQKLNDFPNVNLLGYISTNGSMRPIDQVLADSREYATWSDPGASGKFSLDGLYFDDVPLTKDTEGESRYMDLVDWAVKGDDTFGREPIAIHNTKGVPSYFDNTTDITIVFDGTYEEYLDQRETLRKLDDHLRSKLGLFVTSVPSEDLNVTEVVKEMSKIAANLYITESTGDEYGSLGPLWAQFVNAVTKLDA